MLEQGILHTKNQLCLIISSYNYYFFQSSMQTGILKLGQKKGILQDMEGLLCNHVEVPVEIQGMENFQDLGAQHHTQYIVKPSV